jgi:hypothetical protein
MLGGVQFAGRPRASVEILGVWRVRQFVFDAYVESDRK